MGSRSKDIFLDSGRSPDEGCGFATHVKQFGGVEPHEDKILSTLASQPTPNFLQTSGSVGPPRAAQCGASFTRSLNKCGSSSPLVGTSEKERCLLSLMLPKESEKTMGCANLTKKSLVGKGVKMEGHKLKGDIYASVDDGNNETEDADDDFSAGVQPHSFCTPHSGAGTQPLEDRLCLEDLRKIMSFFSTNCKFFETSLAEAPSREDDTALVNNADSCLSSSVLPSQKRNSEACAAASNTCEESPLTARGRSAMGGRFIALREVGKSLRSRAGKEYLVRTKEDLQQVLVSRDASFQTSGSEAYTRVLKTGQFLQAVKAVCPETAEEDIMDLMRKVDYDDRGCMTWDDFTTFLLSHGNHRFNFAQGNVFELLTVPEPKFCLPSLQHVMGTCMEVDVQHNLLLTGGSEGIVRAWNFDTLTSRGVLFSGDCWVVGVHWASKAQCFFIVTMDRKVIMLDSKTSEVKRLYRGRSVIDSTPGYMYAYDSVQSVKVGGRPATGGQWHDGGAGVLSPHGRSNEVGWERKKVLSMATGVSPAKRERKNCTLPCVEECTLADLVDSVSCSLFHHTSLREDMLLLATAIGEVRFYAIPKVEMRVVFPHAVLRLHENRINKMSIMFDTSALLTASDDGMVKMTSLETGALLRTFVTSGPEQHSAVHDFDFNPQLRLLVTVGPERYGIVWEYSHEIPMAVLNSHNSPCRCCAMHVNQAQIITSGTDGVIFIFNSQGFHLMQVLHVHQLYPQRVMYDEKRSRLLCLATYPYFHEQQHHAVFECSSKYQGHVAPMVGVVYNEVYDLIVTIDTEGSVMTWKSFNGAPVFTFHLKDFSDSAVMNAARLSCFAMDELGRRLLTGFNNGAVAVWNLVNGQTTHVITAAAENLASTSAVPEVTALGTLIRDGITFFIFACSRKLLFTRESGMFTIATATNWEVPEQYGDVITIQPVSQQIIVCGTSSGALFFYHILAERQEGSALWIMDNADSLQRPVQLSLDGQRGDHAFSVCSSRIVNIFLLQAVSVYIAMVVHSDGTVGLWHTMRRLLMGVVTLRSALPTNGEEVGVSHATMDRESRYFVFADDRGNIHVCTVRLRAAPDEGSMRLPRPPQMQGHDGKPVVYWPGSPFERYPHLKKAVEEREQGSNNSSGEQGKQQQEQKTVVEEKMPYVFSEFSQEYVFHSGFPSVTGVSFVDPPRQEAAAAGGENTPGCEIRKEKEKKGDVERDEVLGKRTKIEEKKSKSFTCSTSSNDGSFIVSSTVKCGGMIAVSSGGDNFTRLFTLDGMSIGECGMNRWTVGKLSTYEFLGVKPARRLPPHSCSVQVLDFLRESRIQERQPAANHTRSLSFRNNLKTTTPRKGSLPCLSVISFTESAPRISSPLGDILCSGVQTECAAGQTPRSQLMRLKEKTQELRKSGKSELEGVLPIFKLSVSGKPVELSTKMRSRRTRDTHFWGLVKDEFIQKLRKLPMESTDEDSASHEVPSDFVDTLNGSLRANTGTVELLSPLNHATKNNVNNMATKNGVEEGVGASLHSRNSTSNVIDAPRRTSLNSHITKVNTGKMMARKTAFLLSANGVCATHSQTPRTSSWVGVNTSTISTEDDTRRNDVIRGHLESQRRMLLFLGRKGSMLEGAQCTKGPTHGTHLVTSYDQALTTHRRLGAPLTMGNRVTNNTTQLQVVHLEKMLPPKGTHAFEVSLLSNERKAINSTPGQNGNS